jgi:hypothetical protein
MIAIVRPNSKKKTYGVLDDIQLTAIEPPMWGLYTYFTNPGYLNMIENKFGLDTRMHIELMTDTPLVRR